MLPTTNIGIRILGVSQIIPNGNKTGFFPLHQEEMQYAHQKGAQVLLVITAMM
jgi:hypothetical protein